MRFSCFGSVGLAAALLATGCGKHTGDDDSSADAAGSGVASLAITPATASVPLTAVGQGYSGTQQYRVEATLSDGTTQDVTTQVEWSTDSLSGIDFDDSGDATATIAGVYPITATLGAATATASLDAQLDGVRVGSGVGSANQAALDGAPDSSQTPTVAYPPAGALFPVNLAPLEVHAQKSDPSQAFARIELTSGDSLTYRDYEACAPSPNPSTFPNACIVTLDPTFATQLAGVSETSDVSIQVRLVAADGTKLGESPAIAAAWARTPLTGGLYYWTTAGTGDTTFNTAIARYDFAGNTSSPTIYLSSADAPAVPSGQPQCIGCHALSPDGSKLAFSLGGSTPGFFSLYDVASVTATATNMNMKFADMTTFSHDGSRAITMSYGDLTLRDADASLAMITDNLFPEVTEEKSHTFWSPTGNYIAFVSWSPSQTDITNGQDTGDMVQGGQIWMASSDGTQPTGSAALLVPRIDGFTSYYPAISDDDSFVVFDRSDCAGPANTPGSWGAGPCDGYNDISARLMLIPRAGGTPVPLDIANGSASPLTTNSWPRWSPDHGTFRGKTLYWVAFSSRRAYGLSLAGSTSDDIKPQLWFAAVAIDPADDPPTQDPSFAAVWLPGQDPSLTGPRGNHTPVWTSKAVPIE